MLLTTTPAVDGQKIEQYLEVVAGEAILGATTNLGISSSALVISSVAAPAPMNGNCRGHATSPCRNSRIGRLSWVQTLWSVLISTTRRWARTTAC